MCIKKKSNKISFFVDASTRFHDYWMLCRHSLPISYGIFCKIVWWRNILQIASFWRIFTVNDKYSLYLTINTCIECCTDISGYHLHYILHQHYFYNNKWSTLWLWNWIFLFLWSIKSTSRNICVEHIKIGPEKLKTTGSLCIFKKSVLILLHNTNLEKITDKKW